MPKRIQFRRQKGFKLPGNAVFVARPTKWGLPYKVVETAAEAKAAGDANMITRKKAMRLYESDLKKKLKSDPEYLKPLRGKDLACYCRLELNCHADILLRYANR
jgi:hypothetical protein